MAKCAAYICRARQASPRDAGRTLRRRERQPEHRQLEAKGRPIGALQLTGQVPPLMAEQRMRAMVFGKFKATRHIRQRKARLPVPRATHSGDQPARLVPDVRLPPAA